MSNFHSGGRRSFGGGGRDGGRPTMHDAVCDNCGNDCKVPFRPSGDKPIYCSNCFEEKGGRGGGRDGDRPRRGGRDGGRSFQGNTGDPSTAKLAKNIEILNMKLDSIISLLSSSEKKTIKPVKVESKKKKVVKSAKAE